MTETTELARFCAQAGQLLLSAPNLDADTERDYVRLFLSPQGALCPPWQSVWADPGQTPGLMGEAHHSALEWYRRFGFEPANQTEPADHAGMLLLFYAFLLQSEGSEAACATFAEQHLHWLPAFAAGLSEHARTPCFRDLGAALLEAFPPSAVLA